MSVASGAENAITSGPSSVLSYRLSRDGSLLVVARGPTPLEDDRHRAELWVMDAAGGHAREVTHNDVEETQPELSPDNTRILFLAETNEKLEPYYNSNLFVMPATGGTPKPLLPDFQYAIDQAAWSPDGSSILAVANMGVHTEIIEIDASHPAVEAAHQAATTTSRRPGVSYRKPARWCSSSTSPRGSATSGRWRFLRREPPLRPHRCVSPGRSTRWRRRSRCRARRKSPGRAPTARPIEGLLFYPTDYVAGRRYPLVVQMHGGPADSDKFGAEPGLLLNYFPVLTGHGYAVLRPNYRGSTGYGNAFLRDVVGGYFRNMQLDVMAGVDALVKRGIADPDRLVVMGWSAGGHLTNKLVTMTTRFKAASAGAGVANWTSMYAQTDARANRTVWFGGTPVAEERADRHVLEPLAAQGRREREDADAVFRRRERRPRAVEPVDRDVPGAQEQRRADASVRRAARRPSVAGAPPSDLQGQHRAGVVCALRARRRVLRA